MSDRQNLNSVFISFRNALIRSISHIVPPKDIEDIVQETYVKVCQVEQKEKINYHRSFLLKTAKNLALDYVKRADYRLNQSLDDEVLETDSENEFIDQTYHATTTNEEFGQFCEAVRELPAQCRRAFILKKVYGYSQKEISEYMNISESTVEKHIANGIKRCTSYINFISKQSSAQDDKVLGKEKRVKL